MDLNTITVQDFKDQFPRDFPYLPTYDNAKLYNAGAIVYYPATELFYKCLLNGTQGITPVAVVSPAHWELHADDIENYIQDSDITRAFAEARAVLNQALYSSDETIKMAFLYLAAHFLVNDIRTAKNGINSMGDQIVNSRSVGNVSESYSIPDAYLKDPILIFYTKSGYGLKYLSLTLASTVGNIGFVYGRTTP